MRHTDAELIQRTLSGDEIAFASLVGKYEKLKFEMQIKKRSLLLAFERGNLYEAILRQRTN